MLCTLPLALLIVSTANAYPKPDALPPHNWSSVSGRLYIHGCKADGLLNSTELDIAAKFALLTVEKGQGLELPGYAEDKMAALAAQWQERRRELGLVKGWAMFYMNAKLDWEFYRLNAEVLAHPSWAVQRDGAKEGNPCTAHGDPSFPQPPHGLLCFNHTKKEVRDAFIATCVNATTNNGFDGCFIDSAGWARGPPYPGSSPKSSESLAKTCNSTAAKMKAIGDGTVTLLADLQNAVGSSKLIIAKDSFRGGSEEYVNTIFPMDTFCSCYSCKWSDKSHGSTYPEICQTQIQEIIRLGKRGQVALAHGQVNRQIEGNPEALKKDFIFSLASFLIAASDHTFFGYSNGWYYNGTEWHSEYDLPLGPPTGDAIQGTGASNMTWTRSFTSGTTVKVNVAEHTAEIKWAQS